MSATDEVAAQNRADFTRYVLQYVHENAGFAFEYAQRNCEFLDVKLSNDTVGPKYIWDVHCRIAQKHDVYVRVDMRCCRLVVTLGTYWKFERNDKCNPPYPYVYCKCLDDALAELAPGQPQIQDCVLAIVRAIICVASRTKAQHWQMWLTPEERTHCGQLFLRGIDRWSSSW